MFKPKHKYHNLLIAITLVIIIYSFIGIATSIAVFTKFNKPVVVDLKNVKISSQLSELEQFLMVAERFKNQHEYDEAYFNCVNYTNDLGKIAKELGFYTKKVKGCPYNNGTCHEFLRISVDFEPQEGMITDYSRRYPLQVEYD